MKSVREACGARISLIDHWQTARTGCHTAVARRNDVFVFGVVLEAGRLGRDVP